jgi:hypothetical protein
VSTPVRPRIVTINPARGRISPVPAHKQSVMNILLDPLTQAFHAGVRVGSAAGRGAGPGPRPRLNPLEKAKGRSVWPS